MTRQDAHTGAPEPLVFSPQRPPLESPTPLRIGQTQDIATAAVFLAFSDSAWITGETLYITSGLR